MFPRMLAFLMHHGSTYRTSVRPLNTQTKRIKDKKDEEMAVFCWLVVAWGNGKSTICIVNWYKYNTKFVETNSIFLLINLDGKEERSL